MTEEEKVVHGINCECFHPQSDLPEVFPKLGEASLLIHDSIDVVDDWMRYFDVTHNEGALKMLSMAYGTIVEGMAMIHQGTAMIHMLHAGAEPEVIEQESKPQPPRAN